MGELIDALKLANRVLEEPHNPHDDICILARQFLRAYEINKSLIAEKDCAYEERNRVVAALATLVPSGVKKTDIEGWDPEWHGCVFIDMSCGQLSWHYHDSQAYLFDGLPAYSGEWDGHSTTEKYERLLEFTQQKGASRP